MNRKKYLVIVICMIVFGNVIPAFSYSYEEQLIYDSLYLKLPWEAGEKQILTQGNKNDCSESYCTHKTSSVDEYALDFSLAEGTPVVAAFGGAVSIYREGETAASAYGNHIKIDHGYFYTLYAHLSSFVESLDECEVYPGMVIGYSGSTGFSSAPHLHFGLYHGYAYEDGYSYSVKSKIVIGNTGYSPYQVVESTEMEPWSKYLSSNFAEGEEGMITCDDDDCTVDTSVGVGGFDPNDFLGSGTTTDPTDTAVPDLPDFIIDELQLQTTWGMESYKYGMNEEIKMHAWVENIGDADWEDGNSHDDIEVRFYLSKGYKEDAHSDWIHVGTDNIQKENLDLDDDPKHEEEGLKLWEYPEIEPGIWNIVVCADRTQDSGNGDGDVAEKHKSNNCSTEAVFEVFDEQQNFPVTDLAVDSFQFLQTPTYAGDPARFGAFVVNNGNVDLSTGIRSSYEVECPGTGRILLTDDGTDPGDLKAGDSAWEETVSAVTMPNVAGTCTAYFTADYENAVAEDDEANNEASFNFTLAARPAPILSIVKFEDDHGCCTTNRGKKLEPHIWVKNSGTATPASNVTVVYQVYSKGTGYTWQTMGYGTIEPRELAPGDTDEDHMDPEGWTIPKTSAWKKQWHTVRGCLRADGSYPTGDPAQGDICATYARYSKK